MSRLVQGFNSVSVSVFFGYFKIRVLVFGSVFGRSSIGMIGCCRLYVRLSLTMCIVALRVSVGGWKVNCRVPGGELPIHFFRHFCCRMYRSETTNSENRTDEITAFGIAMDSVVTWRWRFQIWNFYFLSPKDFEMLRFKCVGSRPWPFKVMWLLCQILRLKCIKFDFRWGSAPYPAGGV